MTVLSDETLSSSGDHAVERVFLDGDEDHVIVGHCLDLCDRFYRDGNDVSLGQRARHRLLLGSGYGRSVESQPSLANRVQVLASRDERHMPSTCRQVSGQKGSESAAADDEVPQAAADHSTTIRVADA